MTYVYHFQSPLNQTLYSDFHRACALAQDAADANGAPVAVLSMGHWTAPWYLVSEGPPEDLDTDDATQTTWYLDELIEPRHWEADE